MRKDVKCPYCGEWQEINHDDGYGYEENETFEQECRDCDTIFAYTTQISFHHEAFKADCLNDEHGAHDFVKGASVGQDYERYDICRVCGFKENVVIIEAV